jgi:hypothetical protein
VVLQITEKKQCASEELVTSGPETLLEMSHDTSTATSEAEPSDGPQPGTCIAVSLVDVSPIEGPQHAAK